MSDPKLSVWGLLDATDPPDEDALLTRRGADFQESGATSLHPAPKAPTPPAPQPTPQVAQVRVDAVGVVYRHVTGAMAKCVGQATSAEIIIGVQQAVLNYQIDLLKQTGKL